MDMSIARNVTLASLARLSRHGLLFGGRERRFATDWAARLQVKYNRDTRPDDVAVGRQPAEGRARQMAEPDAVA